MMKKMMTATEAREKTETLQECVDQDVIQYWIEKINDYIDGAIRRGKFDTSIWQHHIEQNEYTLTGTNGVNRTIWPTDAEWNILKEKYENLGYKILMRGREIEIKW